MTTVSTEEIDQAIARIAGTPDGELLYLFFQRELTGFLEGPDPSPSALRAQNARRRFCAEMMARMGKGIGQNGRPTDERILVFNSRQPAVVSRRESAREWIERTDHEVVKPVKPASSG